MPAEITKGLQSLEPILRKKTGCVVQFIKSYTRVGIELSAGCDSSLLAALAHHILGKDAVAFTCVSPIMPGGEVEKIEKFCSDLDIALIKVNVNEMEKEGFRRNPRDRCFYCRRHREDLIQKEGVKSKVDVLMDGVNKSDMDEFRPGIRAADEAGILHPFIECDIYKHEIRKISKAIGLENWNLPANACLATRVAHGIEITPHILEVIDQGEKAILDMEFSNVRVRYHVTEGKPLARVELERDEILNGFDNQGKISKKLHSIGFTYVTLDLDGYRPAGSSTLDETESD